VGCARHRRRLYRARARRRARVVGVDSDTKVAAFLLLGTIFNVNGTLWNVFVAWATARTAARVRATAAAMTWLNRAVGVVFIYLGAKLALAERG
jgi:threonine/homoserine/homoserine lactone efflux protein